MTTHHEHRDDDHGAASKDVVMRCRLRACTPLLRVRPITSHDGMRRRDTVFALRACERRHTSVPVQCKWRADEGGLTTATRVAIVTFLKSGTTELIDTL